MKKCQYLVEVDDGGNYYCPGNSLPAAPCNKHFLKKDFKKQKTN